MRRFSMGCLCAVAVGLGGCGAQTQQVGSKYVASAPISASQGGTVQVTSADAKNSGTATAAATQIVGASVSIPAGALAADTTITITISTSSVTTGDEQAAGPVVEFGPDGTVFSKPVTVSVPFTLPSGATTSELGVGGLESSGAHLTFNPSQTTVSGGLASIQVSGFTAFGAMLFPPVDAGSPGCGGDAECASGEVCIDGICTFVDAGYGVCPSGDTWVTGPGGNSGYCSGSCDLAVACYCSGGTEHAAVCPENVAAACSALCPAGYTLQPPDAGPGGCSTDADCELGQMCVDGQCQPLMFPDGGFTQCPAGSLWDNTGGYCASNCDAAVACPCADGTSGSAVCPVDVTAACEAVCANHGGYVNPSSCTLPCATGQTCCTAACVDLESDPDNCGACGESCGSGGTCSNGVCVSSSGCASNSDCPVGDVCSSGACTTVACRTNGDCPSGSVCNASTNLCGPASGPTDGGPPDAGHGDGGIVCPTGYTLIDGYCSGMCDSEELCDCADGTMAGAICPQDIGMACAALCSTHGGVAPVDAGSPATCGSNAVCASEETCCSGACADLASDPNNCGACGDACPTGEVCGSGVCGIACQTDADCRGTGTCVNNVCT